MIRIIACRPIDLDMDDKFDRLTAEHTFVYEGSVEGVCAWCKRRVWIGPRSQVAHATDPDWPIACYLCAVIKGSDDDPRGVIITNLGNPEDGWKT